TALLLVASGIGLAIPAFAGRIVDTALERADAGLLRGTVTGLIGLFALLGAVGALESWLMGLAGARLLRDLRARLFERLVTLDAAFFDTRRVGELLSRLGSDLTVVQGAITSQIPGGLQAAARFGGTLVILAWLQPRLTAVALLVVPPVVLVALFFGRRLERVSKQSRDATAEASALAEEALAGIRTVQSFAAEPRLRARYDATLADLLRVQLRSEKLGAGFGGVVTFAAFSAFGLVLGYGGQLMFEGRLSAGELTSFLLYTFSIAVSVGQLGGLYAGYRELKGASARLFEILDTTPRVEAPRTPAPFAVGEGTIAVDGVEFRYPDTERAALDGLSLAVASGEVIAIVGPSGSGKSTLFLLLQRFYDPDRGLVSIDGIDLRTVDPADLRRSIGVVPQEVFLFSGSVADNLRLGSEGATEEELLAALDAASARGFVEALPQGLATEIGERGLRLSAGQRQRLSIARAFLQNPRILLLDEATASLDPDSEAHVHAALERLFVGRTTLVIAHRLATARRAHVIHVLDAGRITASGDHDSLYASSELYRRYWRFQSLETETAPSTPRDRT
ncbi:MAG: ABC transporter ATP-binding protein, partial [Planctomycetota bacterium]